jgi:hypothetical protein
LLIVCGYRRGLRGNAQRADIAVAPLSARPALGRWFHALRTLLVWSFTTTLPRAF